MTWASWNVRRRRLADPAHALRVGVDDRDRAELVERPSAAIRASRTRSRTRATSSGIAHDSPWLSTVIGTCSAAVWTPNGRVGVVDEHRIEGSRTRPQEVRHVAAARPLDVVRVDRPAGDRRHRVLELGALVEPVGVEADGDVALVRVAQDPVDEVGVRAVVLVDLEPDGARLDQRVEVRLVERPGAGLHADVDRPRLHPGEDPLHGERRLLEAGRDERRDAARERGAAARA